MYTEITDYKEIAAWVLYDADCRFCTALAKRFRTLLARRHFELLPLQTPWVRQKLEGPEWRAEIRLLKRDGTLLGGVDALLEISRSFPLTGPIRWLAQFGVIKKLFQGGYRWVARHRHCVSGACGVSGSATAATEIGRGKPKPAKKRPGRKITFLELP